MNSSEAQFNDNLFTHFLDQKDMTMCCSSNILGKELNMETSKYGLYFPLIYDEKESVKEHIEAMEYSSRSARYGPFIDNIVGMNWILPSGKSIKIGERVVKSTTGYDLFKFLLMTGDHFGYPSDYVIRLRPFCDMTYIGKFSGKRDALNRLRQELRASSWNHWIDEMDLIFSEDNEPYIEVTINCQKPEIEHFFNYFHLVASKTQCGFEEIQKNKTKVLPWLTIKCLPSATYDIAENIVKNAGGQVRILLMNGVILVNPENENLARKMIFEMKSELESHGGHIYGNGLENEIKSTNNVEEKWITNLVELWEKL